MSSTHLEVPARRVFRAERISSVVIVGAIAITLTGCSSSGPTAPTTGSLQLTIVGPPGGASANVSIWGPGGFSQVVTSSQTLTDLTPDTYVVTGLSVVVANVKYAAPPTLVNVVASLTSAGATVTYALETDLSITISQVIGGRRSPSGTASVTVTGPGAYLAAGIAESTTLGPLAPGTYTIHADTTYYRENVPNSSIVGFPSPVLQTATVIASVPLTAATVSYSYACLDSVCH